MLSLELFVPAWLLSKCTSFLKQSKDMHVRLISDPNGGGEDVIVNTQPTSYPVSVIKPSPHCALEPLNPCVYIEAEIGCHYITFKVFHM